MKVILTHVSLEFISLGKGKFHTREIGPNPHHPQEELGQHTLCGRAVPFSVEVEQARTMESGHLCKRCLASLVTYWRSGKVEFSG